MILDTQFHDVSRARLKILGKSYGPIILGFVTACPSGYCSEHWASHDTRAAMPFLRTASENHQPKLVRRRDAEDRSSPHSQIGRAEKPTPRLGLRGQASTLQRRLNFRTAQ
jgi:hypothetical protein